MIRRRSDRAISTVHSVAMRWGTGPNSRIATIPEEIQAAQPESVHETRTGLYITGHETSTGVEADVLKLRKELNPDIFTIVDGTSEIGGIKREFTYRPNRAGRGAHADRDDGAQREAIAIDVYFGSVQKFFGAPSGLAVIAVSPRAMERARCFVNEETRHAYRTFVDMKIEEEANLFRNLRGILQLEAAIDDYMERGGIEGLMRETRSRMGLIREAVSESPHLMPAIASHEDRSRLLAHVLPVDRDAQDIIRRLKPYGAVGEGYGPYKDETFRVYASPNIPIAKVERFADQLRKQVRDALRAGPRPIISRNPSRPAPDS